METSTEIKNAAFDEDGDDTQKDRYLTFHIAGESYAIEIQYVNEIFGIQKITEVPNIKEYIKGIINLRGMIVPVVDVRCRFEIDEIDYTEKTCIIVVNYEKVSIGLIVDEVSEVLIIPQDKISKTPPTNKGNQSRFIQGVGRREERIEIILNLAKLLYDEDSAADPSDSMN